MENDVLKDARTRCISLFFKSLTSRADQVLLLGLGVSRSGRFRALFCFDYRSGWVDLDSVSNPMITLPRPTPPRVPQVSPRRLVSDTRICYLYVHFIRSVPPLLLRSFLPSFLPSVL